MNSVSSNKIEISKVYTIRMQRYSDLKILIYGKDSIAQRKISCFTEKNIKPGMNLLTVAPGARKPSHSFPYLTFLIPGEQTNINFINIFFGGGGS